MSSDPRSGIGEGGAWTPAFEGQRPPFEPGHNLSVTHGSYSLLLLRGRAEEVAKGLRNAMAEGYEPRFEAAVAGAAMVAARLERAMEALAAAGNPVDLARLDQDSRGWMRLWFSALGQLGLTPAAASRLRLPAGPPSAVVVMQPKPGGSS